MNRLGAVAVAQPPVADFGMAPYLRRLCIAVLAIAMAGTVHGGPLSSLDGSPQALRAAWAALQESREGFVASESPLRIVSRQSGATLDGTLYGVVDTPLGGMAVALSDAPAWCSVLILDPNVHRCSASEAGIEVEFGERNTPVAFTFQRVSLGDDYLQVRLTAASGPLGTTDYAIAFEAVALGANRTLLHLAFGQRFGVAARIAMAAYFNTVGRDKVGFTVVERDGAGRPVYVRDLRGGLERNLMRYYFGILAYLDSLTVPPKEQPDRRVDAWLALTERYPLQLREAAGYFERKTADVRKQHSGK